MSESLLELVATECRYYDSFRYDGEDIARSVINLVINAAIAACQEAIEHSITDQGDQCIAAITRLKVEPT